MSNPKVLTVSTEPSAYGWRIRLHLEGDLQAYVANNRVADSVCPVRSPNRSRHR